MRLFQMVTVAIAFLASVAVAKADPVDVTYSISGTAGDWTLDFNIANNLTDPTQQINYLAVQLPGFNEVGAPVGWTSFDASPADFNNVWLTAPGTGVAIGTSLDGFLLHLTDDLLPPSIDWFVQGVNDNVGVFFSADGTAVPEPASMALVAAGLVGLGLARRRRMV